MSRYTLFIGHQKSGRRTRKRGGGAGALARRSAHSKNQGTSTRIVSRPCREDIAPLFLDANWAPHHRGRGNPSHAYLFEWGFAYKTTPVPTLARCGAHSASRQRGALPSRHSHEMINDPCRRSQILRMRRASSKRACAASSRDGVGGRKFLYPLVMPYTSIHSSVPQANAQTF